jgi:dipeptidyl aminopeptidase/acylaminoacyl peptidase
MRTELSLRRLDGRVLRRYVLGPNLIYRPFAADGVLAFELHSQIENLVRASRSQVAPVTSGNEIDYGADYARNGELAYLSMQSEIWLYVQERGQEPRRLASLTKLMPRGLRWSPDGRELVFAGSEGGRTHLYIVAAGSGLVRRLPIALDEDLGNPSWSPDGDGLIFTGSSPAGMHLLRLDLASGAPPQVISDYGWAEGVETERGLFARGLGRPGIWRLKDGRGAEQMFPELAAPLDAVSSRASMREWAVAGGRIYGVVSKDPEKARIIARALDGGPPVDVAEAGSAFLGSLTVDPRTGDVVYASRVDEQVDVGVMRLRRG